MFNLSSDSRLKISLAWLVCLTILFATWPVYRSFLNVEIDTNEGWNAFYADAAMGRMPLYPSPEDLITNNYPPLSFYVVGFLGQRIGDVILAGRWISLVSVLVIGVAVASCVGQLKGSKSASVVAGLYFIATMCGFFTDYVGMNDPQLFAQAIMTVGFAFFLAADRHRRGFVLPILMMVVAGFFKHNIVALPMTAVFWLLLKHPKQSWKPGLAAVLAISLGLLICCHVYGPDFLINMLAHRFYTWRHPVGAIGHLQWVIVGLAAWIYVGFVRRRQSNAQLCNLLIGISLVMFFVQKAGDGVGHNAQFDLVIAVSMAVGLIFDELAQPDFARTYSPAFLRAAFVTMICCRLMLTSRFEPVRLLVDHRFHESLKASQALMADSIARAKATPCEVAGSTYICYRSGKSFAIDLFNTGQRIKLGRLPSDAISRLVATGAVEIVSLEESEPVRAFMATALTDVVPHE